MFKAFITIILLSINLFNTKQPVIRPIPKPLKTGWYYISDSKTDYPRQLYHSHDIYYIEPVPIVAPGHFKKIEPDSRQYNGANVPYIIIWFDSAGTAAWELATGKAMYKKLALVVDDQLVYAPRVESQITGGVSILELGPAPAKDEIERFEKILRTEMQNAAAKK